jgi:hypothetical protein
MFFNLTCHSCFQLENNKMKYSFVIFIISILGIFNCIGQESTYVSKCREYHRLKKYECMTLKLLPSNKFQYEEIAVDTPIEILEGKYLLNSDTLLLIPDNIQPELNFDILNKPDTFKNILYKFQTRNGESIIADSIKIKGCTIKVGDSEYSFSAPARFSIFVNGTEISIPCKYVDSDKNAIIVVNIPIKIYIKKKNKLLGLIDNRVKMKIK